MTPLEPLPLPDPEGLEEARQRAVRQTWLRGIGVVVAGLALYVNLILGVFGTVFVASGVPGPAWIAAALVSLVMVGLPVAALVFLQGWGARGIRGPVEQLRLRFDLQPPSVLRRLLYLGLVLLVGGAAGYLAVEAPLLGWSLIVTAPLASIPFRFRQVGSSWGWVLHLLAWAMLSLFALQLTAPWVGRDGIMWVALATLLASPTTLVNLFAAGRVKAASVATPDQGWGRLEPLLAAHHLAEVYLDRGEGDTFASWLRWVVAMRPTTERTYVLLGRLLEQQGNPRSRDFWVLGTQLVPRGAEVFARLAASVEDPELALAYARFAEGNALRTTTGQAARYTELVRALERAHGVGST